MSYYQKYLKYKNKYLELKSQIGGEFFLNDIVTIRNSGQKGKIITKNDSSTYTVLLENNSTIIVKWYELIQSSLLREKMAIDRELIEKQLKLDKAREAPTAPTAAPYASSVSSSYQTNDPDIVIINPAPTAPTAPTEATEEQNRPCPASKTVGKRVRNLLSEHVGTIVSIVPRVGTVLRSINDYGQCHLEVKYADGTREVGDHNIYRSIN